MSIFELCKTYETPRPPEFKLDHYPFLRNYTGHLLGLQRNRKYCYYNYHHHHDHSSGCQIMSIANVQHTLSGECSIKPVTTLKHCLIDLSCLVLLPVLTKSSLSVCHTVCEPFVNLFVTKLKVPQMWTNGIQIWQFALFEIFMFKCWYFISNEK